MIKRVFMSLLLLFLAFNVVHAQAISGRVINRESVPVEGANVVLQSADSVFVDVALTDSARLFSFGHSMENFRLVVNHMVLLLQDPCSFCPVQRIIIASFSMLREA